MNWLPLFPTVNSVVWKLPEALATKPELLPLDEPAAGMNPQETDELTAFIARIRDEFGLTIFMIENIIWTLLWRFPTGFMYWISVNHCSGHSG